MKLFKRTDPELSREEIEALNELIRLRSCTGPAEAEPFESALLIAYVQNQASAEEIARVERALARSAPLREEVAYLKSLFEPGAQERFDAVHTPQLRPRKSRAWPRGLPVIGIAAALAVLIPLIVFGLIRSNQSSYASAWVQAAPLLPEQFERDALRGSTSDAPVPASAVEAATWSFLAAAEWTGDSLAVTAEHADQSAPGNIRVTLGKVRNSYAAELPVKAEDPELWFLSMPSLRTYRTALRGSHLRAAWPGNDARGLLSITYRVADRYVATPARVLDRP